MLLASGHRPSARSTNSTSPHLSLSLFMLKLVPDRLPLNTLRIALQRVKARLRPRWTGHRSHWDLMLRTARLMKCKKLCKLFFWRAVVQLTNALRRESVYSVATTNPGDGTKRLYDETTYIADGSDIDGVHPDAVQHTIKREAQTNIRNLSDDEESLTYLEDTEPRG